MTPDFEKMARELAAQLVPHTTSVHNVNVIKAAIRAGMERAADSLAEMSAKWHPEERESIAQLADAIRSEAASVGGVE